MKKMLEDYRMQSSCDYKTDPVFLKSFLDGETYEAVVELLDIRPLQEPKKKIPAKSDFVKKPALREPVDVKNDKWELSVNLGSTQLERNRTYHGNPYLKFLNNPEKHASKWRKQEPMKAKDILNASTVEKSKFITDKIIGDFIKWKESICDSKDVEIDETVMRQLFEIGIKKPEKPKIFRRRVIPRDIFEPKMMKQKNTWTHVKKHFGKPPVKEHTMLKCSKDIIKPKETQEGGSHNTEKQTVVWGKFTIGDITSRVWKNKLNYKCVQAFCNYLEKNPQIKKPEYLIQMNMFSTSGAATPEDRT